DLTRFAGRDVTVIGAGQADADEVRLTALGAYLPFLTGPVSVQPAVPTLLIRTADRAFADLPSRTALTRTVRAPGNRLTLLTEHAPAAARLIRTWLGSTSGPAATVPPTGHPGPRI
ncbi:hypothetical protein, partial [Streptomyces sp. NPDC050804]|uniref:hypothetical protein n=1 Tax=Streptomyces sp. NPDC050804 TaxID=3154745 RepID=UPI003420FB2B